MPNIKRQMENENYRKTFALLLVICQSLEAFLIRRAGDTTFGDDRRDVTVRRHIESRIGDVDSVRGEPDVLDVSDLTFVTLFNRDLIAGRDFEVEGRDR